MLEKVKEVLGNSSALAQALTDVVAGAFANRFLGRARRPLMLTHTVTFGCNARCIMCDSWKKETSDDLTLEQIKAVYNELPRMAVEG